MEGYGNYITSALAVWINNDRTIKEFVTEVALMHPSVREFSDYLQGWVYERLPGEDDRSGELEAFITWGMTSVNWDQLAGYLWRDARREENERNMT